MITFRIVGSDAMVGDGPPWLRMVKAMLARTPVQVRAGGFTLRLLKTRQGGCSPQRRGWPADRPVTARAALHGHVFVTSRFLLRRS